MSPFSVIPLPREVHPQAGCFRLSRDTTILNATSVAPCLDRWFQSALLSISSAKFGLSESEGPNQIRLVEVPGFEPESYELTINPNHVEIRASDRSGLLYGLVTLLQLVPINEPVAPGEWDLPCVQVQDVPRFSWRGVMLDSSRYIQPVSWIKKFLELMALYKLNVLHWHLTDDQGWRIEIERYPALTTVSAWRKSTRTGHEIGSSEADFDGRIHGGFYSKAQLREIVAYADTLGITIVPEIEMPGHAQEVLAAYPDLGCTGEAMEVSTRWGIHEEVFCAGNDEVLTFLENVLDEVLEIFPSEFIHVGGDECPKARWKSCPRCQRRIRDEKLQDESELQSWFIRHFDGFLRSRNRRLIGWDEILEGGLAKNAAVMSWRGYGGGIEAALSGHDVVMVPKEDVYLDYYQASDSSAEPLAIGGFVPLKRVYLHDPVPEGLDESARGHILGGQGAIWTEYMPRPENVEYMAFPRVCALAERLWSSSEVRDFSDFAARLAPQLSLLDRLQVNYRRPRTEDLY